MTDEDGIDGPFERRVSRIPATHGVCDGCGGQRPLRADGSVRVHRPRRWHQESCPGSGKPPRSP